MISNWRQGCNSNEIKEKKIEKSDERYDSQKQYILWNIFGIFISYSIFVRQNKIC